MASSASLRPILSLQSRCCYGRGLPPRIRIHGGRGERSLSWLRRSFGRPQTRVASVEVGAAAADPNADPEGERIRFQDTDTSTGIDSVPPHIDPPKWFDRSTTSKQLALDLGFEIETDTLKEEKSKGDESSLDDISVDEEKNAPKSKCVSKYYFERKDNLHPPSVLGEKAGMWFPFLDRLRDRDKSVSSSCVLELLDPFLYDGRKMKIHSVVANRTYAICPVVEGLADLGNISAVFRTSEALGFQSVHVTSNEKLRRYKKQRKISMGSEKWIDVELWDTTKQCLDALRLRGYRIAVTYAADDTVSILDMDWTIPTVVIFGNEHRGVSEDAVRLSDIRCSIPMSGMVDSFNVSVAAGIVMHHAVNDRIARLGKNGDLLPEEQKILAADFYLRHSPQSVHVVERLLEEKQAGKQSSLGGVLKGELEVGIELPEYLQVQ